MVYNSSTNVLQFGGRIRHHRKRPRQKIARMKEKLCKVNALSSTAA